MKYEEMSDISTIVIEPTDEKMAVLNRVSMQQKPVVVVLPDQTSRIFQHPADFVELRRVRRRVGTSISLVIMGSERLRQSARRHGFPVYTSTEACIKALARRERLQTRQTPHTGDLTSLMRTLPTTGPLKPGRDSGDRREDKDGWPGWEYESMDRSDDMARINNVDDDGWPGWEYARMDLSDGLLPPLCQDGHVTGWEAVWSARENSEEMPEFPAWPSARFPSYQEDGWPGWASGLRDTDPGTPQAGTTPSLYASRPSQYASMLLSHRESSGGLPVEPTRDTGKLAELTVPVKSFVVSHTFMLILVGILLLGVVGGISFGYLLAASHAMPGAFLQDFPG